MLLCGAGVVLAFFRRVPAVAVSYAAMIVAALSGLVAFSSAQLWFWGAATLIAVGIGYLTQPSAEGAPRYYIAGGALVGALVGLVLSTVAAVIVASAAGAFLGLMAWSRTPAGRMQRGADTLNTLASAGLPAVVNFAMVMLIFAQLLN